MRKEKDMNIDNLKFILQRIDLNVDKTNTKATIILAMSTFLLGAFAQNLSIIKKIMNYGRIYYFLILVSIIGLAITIYFSITAIIPIFPKKNNIMKNNSLIYFGSICNSNNEEYIKKANSYSYSFKHDLCKQIVENSNIAYEKFIKLERAFRFLLLLTLVPLFLIFVCAIFGGKI